MSKFRCIRCARDLITSRTGPQRLCMWCEDDVDLCGECRGKGGNEVSGVCIECHGHGYLPYPIEHAPRSAQ